MGGNIIHLLSDNTTALSWIFYVTLTPNQLLQCLARLYVVLLVAAYCLLTHVILDHLSGIKITELDAFSPLKKQGLKLEQISSVIKK